MTPSPPAQAEGSETVEQIAERLLPCHCHVHATEHIVKSEHSQNCRSRLQPAVAAALQSERDSRDRRIAELEAALETIAQTCDDEIKARFGGHNSMTAEECGGKSRVYALLVLPRNIARRALTPGENS